MINASEVREKLAALLKDNLSLDVFEDWLVGQSWNMHRDSAPDAQDLVSAIELSLSEYSSGHVNEAQLRDGLVSLLNNISESLFIGGSDAPVPLAPRTSAKAYWVRPAQRWALPASA